MKELLKRTLAFLEAYEWCVDDARRTYCDYCQVRTRAKNPSRKNHGDGCPWVALTDDIRAALRVPEETER